MSVPDVQEENRDEKITGTVESVIHEVICLEIDQWANIEAKKPRTDQGYGHNRHEAAKKIIELIRSHDHE